MKKVICILFSFVILLTSVFADKSRFYENGKVIDTMYVNSEDGLKVRDYPSLKSNRLCGLTHRSPVKVVAIGKEETIDGITAPWVEILLPRYEWKDFEAEYGWVFGGYLSAKQATFSTKGWTDWNFKNYLSNCYDDRHTGLPFLEKKDDPKLISVMKKVLETNKKIKVECEEGSSIIKVKFGGEYEGN